MYILLYLDGCDSHIALDLKSGSMYHSSVPLLTPFRRGLTLQDQPLPGLRVLFYSFLLCSPIVLCMVGSTSPGSTGLICCFPIVLCMVGGSSLLLCPPLTTYSSLVTLLPSYSVITHWQFIFILYDLALEQMCIKVVVQYQIINQSLVIREKYVLLLADSWHLRSFKWSTWNFGRKCSNTTCYF